MLGLSQETRYDWLTQRTPATEAFYYHNNAFNPYQTYKKVFLNVLV